MGSVGGREPAEGWVNVQAVMRYTGLPRATLYRRMREGLPFKKIGRHPMFRMAEVDAWFAGQPDPVSRKRAAAIQREILMRNALAKLTRMLEIELAAMPDQEPLPVMIEKYGWEGGYARRAAGLLGRLAGAGPPGPPSKSCPGRTSPARYPRSDPQGRRISQSTSARG